MCRHLAYLGPPIAPERLLFDAPHALVQQAVAPRYQTATPDNPDGWGVAWYPHRARVPRAHRSATPMWDDIAFFSDPPAASGAFVAAARAASPGSVVDVSGNAPFVAGRWAFSLNGSVPAFHDGVGEELRDRVSPSRREALVGDTDSEVLLALVLDEIERKTKPAAALAGVATRVHDRAGGRINLLLVDGRRVFATAIGNSLFVRNTRGATVVASEPLDDATGWERVPDRSLVEATAERSASVPL